MQERLDKAVTRVVVKRKGMSRLTTVLMLQMRELLRLTFCFSHGDFDQWPDGSELKCDAPKRNMSIHGSGMTCDVTVSRELLLPISLQDFIQPLSVGIRDELWPDSINHDPSMQPQSKPNLPSLPSSRPQDQHSFKFHEVCLISCNTSIPHARLHRNRLPSFPSSQPPGQPTPFVLSQLGAFVGGPEGFSDPSRLDERDVSSIWGGSQPQLYPVRK